MDAETSQRVAGARRVAERYCRAWLDGDLDGVLACYADDFTLHYFGDNPYSGDHIGRDNAVETLAAAGALARRRLVSVDDILAGPDSAVVVATEALMVEGTEHEVRRILRYRITGDHMTDCWLYEEDQALVDRAWSAD